MRKNSGGRKRAVVLTVMLVGVLVSFLAVPEISLAAMKVPKDLSLAATGDQSPAMFSHEKHVTERKEKCGACHTKLFQMKAGKTAKKKGKLTMAAMEEGKFCGACHNGEKAFSVKAADNNCAKCHMKK
jgi:c(7)-type cytochrome triheme protein